MIVFKYILLIFIFIYIIIINNYLNEKFVITYGKYMPRYYIKNYYDFQKRIFKEFNEDGEFVADHPCIGEGNDTVNNKINKISLLSIYKIGNKDYIEIPRILTYVGRRPHNPQEGKYNKILTLATGRYKTTFHKYIYIVTLSDKYFQLEHLKPPDHWGDNILDNIYNNNFNGRVENGKKTNTLYEYTKTISQLGNDDNNRLLYYLFTDYNFEEIKKYFVNDVNDVNDVNEIIISFVLNFNLNNLYKINK